MTFAEIVQVAGTIIVSVSGAGAIIVWFANYFGSILAKKYEEKVKSEFQMKLTEYQNQLDILKQTTLRYSDKQFEHYSQLWSSVYDLKVLADNLWESATHPYIRAFARQLRQTKAEVEKHSLFIEDNHYQELTEILNTFASYQYGKSSLINYRDMHSDYPLDQLISDNGSTKARFEFLIQNIKADLKRQIGGR